MFEKFNFSQKQIDKYYQAALRDFKIARDAVVPEVIFRFCYDCLIKLAIAVCAKNNLRVKARQGHHIELIQKLSIYLRDVEIEIIANEMRSKRNWDLYGGGILISQKEVKDYFKWLKQVLNKIELYLNSQQQFLKFKKQ